jgi:DNA damage-binding protein 1
MIAHPDPELIFFTYIEPEVGRGELVVKKCLPLFERAPRPAEFFNDVLVHPSGQFAVVSCYAGKLKIVKLKAGSYQEDSDVS